MTLFVSDLDHTLVHQHYVSEKDKQAVQRLLSAGYDLCFASGRQEPSMHLALEWVPAPYHVISVNGGEIRTKDGDKIHSAHVPPHVVGAIMKALEEYDVGHVACTDTERFTTKWNISHDAFISMTKEPILSATYEELTKKHIRKLFFYTESGKIEWVHKNLHKEFHPYVSLLRSGLEFVDIMPTGTDKAYAVERLRKHIGHEGLWVAIGDSQNDIEMLKQAPISFSFTYAPREVRAHAKHIVSSFAEAVSLLLH